MAIYQYLDISTAHITEKDRDLLTKGICDNNPVYPHNYDYGVFITLPGEKKTLSIKMTKYGYSSSFCKLVDYAIKNKCELIRLDCDADIIESDNLDTHSW